MSFPPRLCAATGSSCVQFLAMPPTTATRIGKPLAVSSIPGQKEGLRPRHAHLMIAWVHSFFPEVPKKRATILVFLGHSGPSMLLQYKTSSSELLAALLGSGTSGP